MPSTSADASDSSLSFKERLQTAMQQSAAAALSVDGSTSEKQLMNAIKSEMALFNNSGKRGTFLQTAYSYLLTVPPTDFSRGRAGSSQQPDFLSRSFVQGSATSPLTCCVSCVLSMHANRKTDSFISQSELTFA